MHVRDMTAEQRLDATPTRRVSVDCEDAWFRLGLVACLREARFDVVADNDDPESDGPEPTPAFGSLDFVILEWSGLNAVRSLASGDSSATGMVVIVRELSALSAAVSWAAGRAGTGFLMRDGLTPESLLDCLRVVAGGGVVLPGRYARGLVSDICRATPAAVTEIERQLLCRIQQGETNVQIAAGLHLSVRSIKRMLQRLYSRLELGGRVDAAVYATRLFGDPFFDGHHERTT